MTQENPAPTAPADSESQTSTESPASPDLASAPTASAGDPPGAAEPAGPGAPGEAREQREQREGRHGRRRYRDRDRGDRPPRDANGDDDRGSRGDRPPPAPLPPLPPNAPTSLTQLKRMNADQLLDLAEACGIGEGVARQRKQDIIFNLLKVLCRTQEGIDAEGVVEILQDGFGFLRAFESSYLAGPDDIYVSPAQVRRFNLRTGDYVTGKMRAPKDGERYFALLKVNEINGEPPEASKN